MQADEWRTRKALVVPLLLSLAAICGPFCALMLLPLLRFARSAHTVLHSPLRHEAKLASPQKGLDMPIRASVMTKVAVVAAAVTPAMGALLWLKPVSEELLGLGEDARAAAQGSILILGGMICCRTLPDLL
jgi:hypothetical protein